MIEIFDVSGKMVFQKRVIGKDGSAPVNISNLNNGLYYYELVSGNEIAGKGKLEILK